jgi:hypothetical protein
MYLFFICVFRGAVSAFYAAGINGHDLELVVNLLKKGEHWTDFIKGLVRLCLWLWKWCFDFVRVIGGILSRAR